MIISRQSFSPRTIQHDTGGQGWLPNLQSWADVTFLTWMNEVQLHNQANPEDPKKASDIKYVLRSRLWNRDQRKEIYNALANANELRFIRSDSRKVRKWGAEKTYFRCGIRDNTEGISDPEIKLCWSLLGTKAGKGVSLFLLTHKHILGFKRVKSITLFGDSCQPWTNRRTIETLDLDAEGFTPDLLFEFEDVEPDGGDDRPPGASKPPVPFGDPYQTTYFHENGVAMAPPSSH